VVLGKNILQRSIHGLMHLKLACWPWNPMVDFERGRKCSTTWRAFSPSHCTSSSTTAVRRGPSPRAYAGPVSRPIRSRPPNGTRTASVVAKCKSWAICPIRRYKWRMLPTFLLTSVGELGVVSLTSHAPPEALQRH
jgi:hypothetical protein